MDDARGQGESSDDNWEQEIAISGINPRIEACGNLFGSLITRIRQDSLRVEMSKGRWLICGILSAVTVVSPRQARAQVQFEAGVRTGYGMSFGEVSSIQQNDLHSIIAGQVPIWIELGARIQRRLFIGGYFSYGFGVLGRTAARGCERANDEARLQGNSVECSQRDLRLGLELLYHLRWTSGASPFVGIGAGYEWLLLEDFSNTDGTTTRLSVSPRGPEFINLQLGVDFSMSQYVDLGPFIAFSAGQYDSVTYKCEGDCLPGFSGSQEIGRRSLHHWFFMGVRGSLQP